MKKKNIKIREEKEKKNLFVKDEDGKLIYSYKNNLTISYWDILGHWRHVKKVLTVASIP